MMINKQLERCTSCGLWKKKWSGCLHCISRPNRLQMTAVDFDPASIGLTMQTVHSPSHTKERCSSCGLWKSPTTDCTHCSKRPNRIQVNAGHASKLHTSPEPLGVHDAAIKHTRERCHSCGLWKLKIQNCMHCESRPNRKQAAQASLRAEDGRRRQAPVHNHHWFFKIDTEAKEEGGTHP